MDLLAMGQKRGKDGNKINSTLTSWENLDIPIFEWHYVPQLKNVDFLRTANGLVDSNLDIPIFEWHYVPQLKNVDFLRTANGLVDSNLVLWLIEYWCSVQAEVGHYFYGSKRTCWYQFNHSRDIRKCRWVKPFWVHFISLLRWKKTVGK